MLVLFALTFAGIIFLPDNNQKEIIPYSTNSAEDNGCLASYLLLEELDFNVGRYEEKFNMPDNISSLLYINYPSRNINQEERDMILSWVHDDGNRFILAGSYKTFLDSSAHKEIIDEIESNIKADENGEKENVLENELEKEMERSLFTDVSYGNGIIRIIHNHELFANAVLRIEGSAKNLVSALFDLKEGSLYFYEYRSSSADAADKKYGIEGAFKLLPVPARFILLQLFLSLLLYIAFTGRRIGPPVVNREINYRPDNENITAAAALMDRLKLRGMAFSLYMDDFINEISSHLKCFTREEILSSWEENNYKHKDLLSEVLYYAFDNKESLNNLENKEMQRLARAMDLLKREKHYGKRRGR